MSQKNSLSWGVRAGYGIGSIGESCPYSLIGTFLLFFLTTVAGIDPITAGTIAAIGAIWDAICSPIIGYASDNIKSKYGRRLTFIFFAAFPLGISVALLFNSIDADGYIKIIYYILMVLIFWTSFSFYFVPYMAMGAEITGDYHERTILRSVAYGFTLGGMVMGMVAPTFIVDLLINNSFNVQKAWWSTGIIIAVFSILTALISCAALKNTVKEKGLEILKKAETKNNLIKKKVSKKFLTMIKEYWEVLKIKPTKFVLFASICYLIANTMNYSDRIYFMTFILKMDAKTITVVMFSAIISGAIFIPFIIKASSKLDKRTVYIFCMGAGAFYSIFSRIFGINSFVEMLIFLFIFACANSSYWQLMPAMIYDVCEVDEAINGQRREGSVISLQALSESVASALSMQLLGIILSLAEFDGDAKIQSEITNVWIENAFSLIPGIFMLISAFMIYKYPITKKQFEFVQKELQIKKNGGDIDFNNIKDLI